jgi:hypothetical protein
MDAGASALDGAPKVGVGMVFAIFFITEGAAYPTAIALSGVRVLPESPNARVKTPPAIMRRTVIIQYRGRLPYVGSLGSVFKPTQCNSSASIPPKTPQRISEVDVINRFLRVN